MKTVVNFMIVILAVAVFVQKSSAQNADPVFNGNSASESLIHYESIDDYMNIHVVYPDEPAKCCIQGTEVVKFTVTAEGNVSGFKVVNSVCSKMDEEVIRILKTTNSKWQAATINGNAVDMEQEVSVVFKLHETTDFAKMSNVYLQKGNKWLFVKNRPDKALKYFDCAINLLPNSETLLAVRGLCRYENGDNEGATADWTRLKEIAEGSDLIKESLAEDCSEMKGFTAMWATLEN